MTSSSHVNPSLPAMILLFDLRKPPHVVGRPTLLSTKIQCQHHFVPSSPGPCHHHNLGWHVISTCFVDQEAHDLLSIKLSWLASVTLVLIPAGLILIMILSVLISPIPLTMISADVEEPDDHQCPALHELSLKLYPAAVVVLVDELHGFASPVQQVALVLSMSC